MTAGQSTESREDRISDEAVQAAAIALAVDYRSTPPLLFRPLARRVLAAALPHLERRIRESIAGELREYRAGIIRDDEIPADPRERDPYDRGYCSGLEHAAQWVNRGQVSS